MTLWYWKNGKPAIPKNVKTGSDEWAKCMMEIEKKLMDKSYKTIGRTTTWAKVTVSTVWLGLDHEAFSNPNENHKPMIFETMVFGYKGDVLSVNRDDTEKNAKLTHERMVKYWSTPTNLLTEWWKGKRG